MITAATAVALVFASTTSADEKISLTQEKLGKGAGERYAFASFCDANSRKLYVFGGERNVYEGDKFTYFEFPEGMLVAKCDSKKPAFEKLKIKGELPELRAYTDFAYCAKTRKAYMFGGFVNSGKETVFSNDFWVFSAEKETWEKLHESGIKDNPPVRDAHAICTDDDGETVWLFGGLAGFEPFTVRNDLWKYDVKSKKWSEVKLDGVIDFPKARPTARYLATLTSIGDNKALLAGGITSDEKGGDRLLQLDLKTGDWKQLSAAPKPQVFHDAAWHPQMKRLLVLNGAASLNEDAAITDAVMAYDPATNKWEEAGKSGHAHTYGASVLDPGTGTVFTFGGLKDASFLGKHAPDELHCIAVKERKK
jgi:N-acetylneuraminic acid mutarotase